MERELMNDRKKIIMDIINSESYVPMKLKEMAMIASMNSKMYKK